MAIKEIPTNFRVYYKAMRTAIRPKYEKAVDDYERLIVEEKALYSEVKSLLDVYKGKYKFNLLDYDEFVNNCYSTGEFYNDAKGLFINKKQDYKATNILYKLYKLARQQRDLYNNKHQIDIWDVMLNLTIDEYKAVLQQFYNEVSRQLIVNGYGYVFEQPIGWMCINRCKVVQGERRILDFQATKKNKAKLLAEGKRLWNQEEARYAASIGAEYEGVDYRVYKDEEYCYEFVLLNCKAVPGERIKFKITDSHRCINGKTEDDLVAECDNDLNKICNLGLNPRRKLYICLKLDNILYLNFIRNDAQQSAHTPKANRKSRQ